MLAACVALGCAQRVYPASFAPPSNLRAVDASAPFLKCHLASGDVLVLEAWTIDEPRRLVEGSGLRYGPNREVVATGKLGVSMDEVVLFETNKPESVNKVWPEVVVLGVMSAASAALTGVCIANPKTCFGSCPTFFAADAAGRESLQAEGFSSSVARSLEATDVDAMWTARPHAGAFDVVMTNDAYETHAVDSVRLLAVARPEGARVLRAGDAYFVASRIDAPQRAFASSGDVTAALSSADGDEFHSAASATDLAEKETVELTFARPTAAAGIVLRARAGLLTTFLFYQELAFMGRRAGDWMTMIEQAGEAPLRKAHALLGGIEVLVRNGSGAWVSVGTRDEMGPIARETDMLPLPADALPASGDLHVRLVMTKGDWRVDQVGLAAIDRRAEPIALSPVEVRRGDELDPRAKEALMPGGEHLVTVRGDAYRLRFDLPREDVELFLESRGYYYEWIRPEWLREEDQAAAAAMLASPDVMMKKLAPKYGEIEGVIDAAFWASRYDRGPR